MNLETNYLPFKIICIINSHIENLHCNSNLAPHKLKHMFCLLMKIKITLHMNKIN